MSNTIKIKRGTNLSNAGTPAAGELIYKSDTNQLYVGDGSTAATGLSPIGGDSSADITSVVAGTGLTGGANSGAATLNIGAGTGIDVAADAISVDVSDFMSNGANNYIVTSTGTDAMNAEANLQFGGSHLKLLVDDGKFLAGANEDAYFMHSGSHAWLNNSTGNLYIRNQTDDGQIIMQTDDGSGATTTYMSLKGNEQLIRFLKSTRHNDSVNAQFGTSADLKIRHDGSNSIIQADGTGDLIIKQDTADKDILLRCDDGSGGSATYLTLDGSAGYTVASKQIRSNDNVALTAGTDGDLNMVHNGTNSFLENWNGDLYIRNNHNDKDVILQSDDGSGGVTAYLTLDGSTVKTDFNKPISVEDSGFFPDSSVLYFGTGNDLRIQHNGSNSFIQQYGTGDLYIDNTVDDKSIAFRTDDGTGGVTAYYTVDGANLINKFYKHIRLPVDSQRISVGAGNDLSMTHDGTNSYIDNGTGMLFIRNTASNQDIRFTVNDGGVTSNLLTLNSASSRVGINTTAPADRLHIYESGNATVRIQGAGGVANIRYQNDAQSWYAGITSAEQFYWYSSQLGATTNMIHTNGDFYTYYDFLISTNNRALEGRETGGTIRSLIKLNSSNQIEVGSNPELVLKTGGGGRYVISSAGAHNIYGTLATNSDVTVGNKHNPTLSIMNTATGAGSGPTLEFGHNQGGGSRAAAIKTYLTDGSTTNRTSLLRFHHTQQNADVLKLQLGDNYVRQYQKGDTSDYLETMVHDTHAEFHVASGNYIKTSTDSGYALFGPQNTSWNHIYTSAPGHLFDKYVTALDGNFQSYSGVDLSLRRSQGSADRIDITADYSRVIVNNTERFRVTTTGATVTGALAVTGTVDGRDVASDGSKLDGIESGATADQTAAQILTAIKTVDGTGTGLDADLLDGLQGSSYWTKNGSWVGDLGSNGYTRVQGVSNGGGEFVLALKNGQLNTLIDGSYFAYEGNSAAGGGFWSSYNSAYANATGFKSSDTSTIKVIQQDGGDGNLIVTGNITAEEAIISTSRDEGVFGTYDPAKTDHIWSMGTAYKNHASGTNFGNLYGLAYKHTNNTTGGNMGGGHQMVWCTNGVPKGSIGEVSIWSQNYFYAAGNYGASWDTNRNTALTFAASLASTAYNVLRVDTDNGFKLQTLGGTGGTQRWYTSGSNYIQFSGTTITATLSGTATSANNLRDSSNNLVRIDGSNELNFYNSSGSAAALYINHHGSNSEVNLANSGAQVGQTYGVRVPDGSATTPTHSFNSDTNTGMYRLGDDDLGFTAGGSLKYGILNGLNRFYSNVVVGPNNNNSKPYIQYKDGYDAANAPSYSWYYDNGCGIGHPAASVIAFSTGSNERGRFTNSGLSVTGSISASADVVAYVSSDKRLKDNIKNIANPLDKLNKLNGIEFDWNDKQDLYKGHDIGVIAQEVEEVLPEIVDTREDGHKAVKYDRMVALLIEAVKEQQVQINELKTKLGE